MTAPSSAQAGDALRWQRIRTIENPWVRQGLAALAVVYLLWSLTTLEINWTRVAQGLPRAVNLVLRMFPPDFSRWGLLFRGTLESVQMALAASFFGMILAVPIGICGASNLVPKPVYFAARAFIILSRTFHEIIVAIFFVKIFGFGPLAGVLTLLKDVLLVKPESPDDLAEKISCVLHNQKVAEELARNAYKTADAFSWEKRAERLSEFFYRVHAESQRK